MTRDEHLQWAKQRALEYVYAADLQGAVASMVSDLRKHPELYDHSGMQLGAMLLTAGFLDSADKMRKFIEEFN